MATIAETSLKMSPETRALTPWTDRAYSILYDQQPVTRAGRVQPVKRKTPHIELIEKRLKNFPGVKVYYEDTRGGHIRATFEYNGKREFYFIPGSSSDRRGPQNAWSQIRAMLIQKLGAVEAR